MNQPLYIWRSDDRDRGLREELQIGLIGRIGIHVLQADTKVTCERWAGLAKSYVALRSSPARTGSLVEDAPGG